jgi:hypothetical protein
VGYSTVLSVQALLLLWLGYHNQNPTLVFYRLKPFVQFIMYTSLLTAVSSAVFLSIYINSQYATANLTLTLWLNWWLGNFNGILIFSCALVTWDAYFPDFYGKKLDRRIYIKFGLLMAFSIALLFSQTQVLTACFLVGIVIMSSVISYNSGWCGAITASFISTIVLCFAALMDVKVFFFYSPWTNLFCSQLFIALNTLTGLAVAVYRSR